MLQEERWASAYLLAVYAIEEVGKSPMILMVLDMPEALRGRAWRGFADHRSKNILASFEDFVSKGAKTFSEFSPMLERDGSHTAEVERGKQSAIYVDCVGARRWTEPATEIGPDQARAMVGNAERRVSADTPWPAERLRIWTKHMAVGHASADAAVAARATLAAYEEMRDAGLITEADVARMRTFLGLSGETPGAEPAGA